MVKLLVEALLGATRPKVALQLEHLVAVQAAHPSGQAEHWASPATE